MNRALSRNIFSLYLVQLANYVIPLLIVPFLALRLGPAGFGAYSIVQVILLYGQIVTDYGFLISATSRIAGCLSRGETVHDLYSRVISLRVLLAIVAFVGGAVALWWHPAVTPTGSLLLALAVFLLSQALTSLWLYQGYQEMHLVSIVILLTRLVAAGATLMFVRGPADVEMAIWAQSVAALIAAAVSLLASRKYELHFQFPLPASLWAELRESWAIFQSVIFGYLFLNSGLLILGSFAPLAVVGGYAVAEKVARALANMLTPITQAIYPRVAAQFGVSERQGIAYLIDKGRLILLGGLLAGLLLALLVPLGVLPLIFGARFQPYADALYWFAPWLFLGVLNNLLGIQYLSNVGASQMYATLAAVASGVGFAAYFVLIPRLSYLGVPMGILLGEFCLSVLLLMAVYRRWQASGRREVRS